MVKILGDGATMATWTFLLCILSVVLAATTPAFEDVSIEKGLLSYDEIDRRNVLSNKYWGSTIADLDKDGYYDIFVSNHGNKPELYFFQPNDMSYSNRNAGLFGYDLHATAAADMDNDGYLEFIINLGGSNGNDVNGHPEVHVTQPDQSFSRKNGDGEEYRDVMGMGGIPHRGRALVFLDINADGFLDVVFLNQKNHSATYSHHVYENLGNGKFVFRNNTGIEEAPGYWGQVVDANNDSYPDILTMSWSGIQLWLGTGDFRFEDGTHLIPDAAANHNKMKRVRCVAEIDYDGDGDLDIILARGNVSPKGGDEDILLQNNEGVFAIVANPGFGDREDHFHVTTGDFNNDGHMDMYFSVMTQFTEPRKPDRMYLNEGDGTFSLAPAHGTESTKAESDGDNANAFDYNLDGRIDLLVGSRNESWKLYENTSDRGSNHYILVRIGEPRGKLVEPQWFHRKALGALVKVFCTHEGTEHVFVQRVGSAGQSHSQSYADTLHFGVGGCTTVDSIEIHYQGEVVVKRTGVAVDQLVTVGMYFPCPAGMLGKACDEVMTQCSTDLCADGEECESVELVGGKCVEQLGCDPTITPVDPPAEPLQLLANGGFEASTVWLRTSNTAYNTAEFSEGSRGMEMPLLYAEVKQTVTLEGGLEYTLMCDEKGDPVRYKVKKDGATLWKNFDAPSTPVDNSDFMAKTLTFTPTDSGVYEVSLVTPSTEAAFIDNCMLFTFDAEPTATPTEAPELELGENLLVEGGFEGLGWEIRAGGELQSAEVYEGESAASLPLSYSDAIQNVELVQGVEYVMQCYELDGPIKYRVFKDGVVTAKRGDRGDSVPGSTWRTKTLNFTADVSGTHEIRVSTTAVIAGQVDSCSLRALEPPAAVRMEAFNLERVLALRGYTATVRQEECLGGCMKLYCPV